MPFVNEEVKLTILLGTTIILFFGVAVVALFSIFTKKNQLNQKEKEIMKANYESTLLQSQLEMQEQTFNDISQEIHDNVGQILSLTKIQISIMNESSNMNSDMLNEIKENISKALTDLRNMAKGLSSDRIRLLNIHETITYELEQINNSGVAHTTVLKEGQERPINEQKKLILFRMIQESIQNCIKHAAASEIKVAFNYGAEMLQVLVIDNGNGFNTGNVLQSNGGLGLMNLKKRAALIGGSADIESVLHQGTSVIIKIPYE